MERKALAALCLLALVALAGCSATGSLSMETADDAEIAEAASRPAVVDSPAPDDRRVVREAIEDGSGTATATDPPVQRGLPLAYEDSYYDIDWNVTGSERGTAFAVGVDHRLAAVCGRNGLGHDRSYGTRGHPPVACVCNRAGARQDRTPAGVRSRPHPVAARAWSR